MRKPLKMYVFLLLLITAFGLLGNVFIQQQPRLAVTDINQNIPGSETLVALYKPLAKTFGETTVIDITVTPVDHMMDAQIIIAATSADEYTLQQQTSIALQQISNVANVSTVTIQWLFNDTTVLQASFTQPFSTITHLNLRERAYTYTFTQL